MMMHQLNHSTVENRVLPVCSGSAEIGIVLLARTIASLFMATAVSAPSL